MARLQYASTVLVLAALAGTAHAKFVMPWMCLEVCDSDSAVAAYVQQLKQNSAYFTALSFESIHLDDDGNVHVMNLTDATAVAKGLGLATFPMCITANLTKMRSLFRNPATWTSQIIALSQQYGWTGINIDFEPDDNGTPQDAADYAAFLDTAAKALHAATPPLQLTVDYDEWNGIWDLSLLNTTQVDYFMSMGTYNANLTWFNRRLHDGMVSFGSRLVVGLETTNDDTGANYTAAELAPRFQALQQAGVTQLAIWDSPIPDAFWPFLSSFGGPVAVAGAGAEEGDKK